MSVPGNHDAGRDYLFSIFKKYFWSPQMIENTRKTYYNFYSWNLGYAHFINFNPIFLIYDSATIDEITTLYTAMMEDLIIANQSRIERPWIIIVSHYPLYCSDDEDE